MTIQHTINTIELAERKCKIKATKNTRWNRKSHVHFVLSVGEARALVRYLKEGPRYIGEML
jgi:hypothetical protein